MTVVTDSKDGHDRLDLDAGVGNSARKSVNLELAIIRAIQDWPQTMVRWTDGSNMLGDALTKEMPADYLWEAPERGTWSIEFRAEMAKDIEARGSRALGGTREGAGQKREVHARSSGGAAR
eukprot:168334-Pyramimonas_sp.AAC.1